MRQIFYQNISQENEKWKGFEITVKENPQPVMILHAGGKNRMRLSYQGKPLFWASPSDDYYDLRILRNRLPWTPEEMLIPPISSQDIEAFRLSNENYYEYWAKYFIQEIKAKHGLFLYDGTWKLLPVIDRIKSLKYTVYAQGYFECIDWEAWTGYELISLKPLPSEQEGRVKWWRKKIKENTLPPILVWNIYNLMSNIIIDGHARLKACILEGVKFPPILELASFINQNPLSESATMMEYIEKRNFLQWKNMKITTKVSTATVNNMLLKPDPERVYTKSRYQYNFEKEWINEVINCINNPDLPYFSKIWNLLRTSSDSDDILAQQLAIGQGWTVEDFQKYLSISEGFYDINLSISTSSS